MITHGPGPRKLSISSDGIGGTVHLADQDISSALTGVSLKLGVGDIPTATLDVLLLDLTSEVEAVIEIPPATHDLLVQLGWTPPLEVKEDKR